MLRFGLNGYLISIILGYSIPSVLMFFVVTDKPVGKAVINEEEYQCSSSNLDFYKLRFISKNGFTDEVDRSKYNLFTLHDFYLFE